MKKKVVILTQKGALSKGLEDNTSINLFVLENDEVVGAENVTLEEVDEKNFSLTMWMKKVSLVYAESISGNLKKMLEDLGIITKCKDEFDDDRFIDQFAFS